MGSYTFRGPNGSDPDEVCSIYDDRLTRGTMTRSDQAVIKPGPVNDAPILTLSLEERFTAVLRRAAPLVPTEMRSAFEQMLTPEALAMMAGMMAAAAIGMYFGVTEVVGLLMAISFLVMAKEAWEAGKHLGLALRITASARTDRDLDDAARHVAAVVAAIGVELFMALVTKGLGKAKAAAKAKGPQAARTTAKAVRAAADAAWAGMPPQHFEAFQAVAKKLSRIIAVRNCKFACIDWIAKGFPPKPLEIKIKTCKKSGLVTIKEETLAGTGLANVEAARKQALDANYYILEQVQGKWVATNKAGHGIDFPDQPGWPPEVGQVIDGAAKKPLTGDYDLLTVVDPKAQKRTLVLASDNYGEMPKNLTNSEEAAVKKAFKELTGQDRVMHGGAEWAMELDDVGDVTLFYPEDPPVKLLAKEVADFFTELGRAQTAFTKQLLDQAKKK